MPPHESLLLDRFAEMKDIHVAPALERNCIGLVLYKPDCTATGLDHPICDFIEREIGQETGKPATLFAFSRVALDRDKVKQLYPEQKHAPYLKYIEDHLTSGPVNMVLVVTPDAPQQLNKLKGSIKTGTGIRGNFLLSNPIDEQTLLRWQSGELSPEETQKIGTDLFAANLVHVPDDQQETKKAIELLYPKSDLSALINSVPLFSRWYSQ